MGWKDSLQDYIPLQTIKVLVQHTISTMLAILCFWLTAVLAKWAFPTGRLHDAIEVIEGIGFIILLGWLFIEMFAQLWKRRHNDKTLTLLVA